MSEAEDVPKSSKIMRKLLGVEAEAPAWEPHFMVDHLHSENSWDWDSAFFGQTYLCFSFIIQHSRGFFTDSRVHWFHLSPQECIAELQGKGYKARTSNMTFQAAKQVLVPHKLDSIWSLQVHHVYIQITIMDSIGIQSACRIFLMKFTANMLFPIVMWPPPQL